MIPTIPAVVRRLYGLMLLGAIAACGGGERQSVTEPPAGPSVTVAEQGALAAGLATQLAATVRSATGVIDPSATIVWSSSDSSRAVVDATGLLVGRAPGNVTITARSGSASGTRDVTILAAPALNACRLPNQTGSVAFGFPRSTTRLKTTGAVKMTVVFVDFSDAPATRTPESVLALLSPAGEDFFRTVSYGRLAVTLAPNLRWLRMSKPSTDYGFQTGLTFALHRAFLQEAVTLAAPTTDFLQTDAVVVVANPDARAIGFGPAFTPNAGSGLTVQGREILNGTNSGADLLVWGGGWLPHEIGHTMSLPDLYDYAPGTTSAHKHVGEFSQMGLISGRAPSWSGFERWQLGWLDDAQVVCLPSGSTLAPLTPLGTTGGQKLLIVPVTTTRAIVIESRRAAGLDDRLTQPGLLVYLIDTSIASGRGTMRVLPENDADASKLNRTVTVGQTVSHLGVSVTLVSTGTGQDLVRIVR